MGQSAVTQDSCYFGWGQGRRDFDILPSANCYSTRKREKELTGNEGTEQINMAFMQETELMSFFKNAFYCSIVDLQCCDNFSCTTK